MNPPPEIPSYISILAAVMMSYFLGDLLPEGVWQRWLLGGKSADTGYGAKAVRRAFAGMAVWIVLALFFTWLDYSVSPLTSRIVVVVLIVYTLIRVLYLVVTWSLGRITAFRRGRRKHQASQIH